MSAITPIRAGLAAIISGILLIAAALMRGDPDDDVESWLDGDDDAGWTRDDHPIWGW